MRILLTGANGFVGSRVKAAMSVIAAPSLRNSTMEDIKRLIDEAKPDVIIHTAAISDIGTCEKNPDASYHANVLIPTYLAEAAGTAKLLLFSTDQVYSGCDDVGPYTEENVNPANTYARHKLEMENRVLDIDPNAVMLRATWMYDMPVYGVANRGNFFVNMLKAGMQHSSMSFSGRQYRGITYVREVAELIGKTIYLPGGVYNFGSENTFSMLDTARFFANELQMNIIFEDVGYRHNLWMDCSKIKKYGISFSSTVNGLRKCVEDYGI